MLTGFSSSYPLGKHPAPLSNIISVSLYGGCGVVFEFFFHELAMIWGVKQQLGEKPLGM